MSQLKYNYTLFFMMFLCNTISAKILTHKEIIKICNKVCIKVENHKCIDRGYKDCNLVSAIINKESSYNEKAFNPEVSGSYGLMQVQCTTAKLLGLKYSCDQLYSPTINIRFGVLFLLNLEKKLKQFKVDDILSTYNAGLKKIADKVYRPIKCSRYRTFNWHGAPEVKCYPGEYINQEYVWHVSRHYKYLSKEQL